ncbi:host cell division inhibitor Icd-like protein [Yersinia bercovieri]
MFFTVLLERSNSRFVFFSCIGIYQWCSVFVDGIYHLVLNQELKITKPGSALTLTGPLTTNVNASNEAAMLNHTPTRFKFLFLAVCRSDLNSKPHRESATAHSEQDARRSLASQFVLSFAGRIPAQGVCNA